MMKNNLEEFLSLLYSMYVCVRVRVCVYGIYNILIIGKVLKEGSTVLCY